MLLPQRRSPALTCCAIDKGRALGTLLLSVSESPRLKYKPLDSQPCILYGISICLLWTIDKWCNLLFFVIFWKLVPTTSVSRWNSSDRWVGKSGQKSKKCWQFLSEHRIGSWLSNLSLDYILVRLVPMLGAWFGYATDYLFWSTLWSNVSCLIHGRKCVEHFLELSPICFVPHPTQVHTSRAHSPVW